VTVFVGASNAAVYFFSISFGSSFSAAGCKVYDLLNFASELATHHASDDGQRGPLNHPPIPILPVMSD
jgi:hypothetical protein